MPEMSVPSTRVETERLESDCREADVRIENEQHARRRPRNGDEASFAGL
jgi:hypothetical protein